MIWHYDNSFEGFCSAVFAIYQAKDVNALLRRGSEAQMGFGDNDYVPTDMKRFHRVHTKLEDISEALPRTLFQAWLSEEPEIDQALLGYIRISLDEDRDPRDQRYNDTVRRVLKAAHDVAVDAYHHLQFIRFVPAGPNIYLADIEPTYDILIFLSGQFTDRLAEQRFLIRDRRRNKCLVWDLQRFWISYDLELQKPPLPQADIFERLWQTYFEHIAIPERINPRLQTQLVPKRYRKYMTEFQK